MKTGRVRKKATPTPQEPAPTPAASKPPAKPAQPIRRPVSTGSTPGTKVPKQKVPYPILIVLGLVLACLVIFVLIATLTGGSREWVEATRAEGTWTATAIVLGPRVAVEERWESDCLADLQGAVQAGSCVLRDAETYQDRVVDDYEEYAYNIYYEETWDLVYQAQGTEFVVTELGSDDWWEDNRHYTRQEELDKSTCQYTSYTVWVEESASSDLEVEVYLSECEVWDHVVVEERVHDQQRWCRCELTTLVEVGRQSEQGSGLEVRWPQPVVPAGGRVEQSFSGAVVFLGDDYEYTATAKDLAAYQDYMTAQYYIGLNGGKPVTVSKTPPR
jgi:hypothetical protein